MKGLPVEIAGLCVVGLLLHHIHLHSKSGVCDSGLVLLGEVKLVMLLEPRAGVVLMQGLEG
jgi:hypothetical protein